jgi:hypothetical protein
MNKKEKEKSVIKGVNKTEGEEEEKEVVLHICPESWRVPWSPSWASWRPWLVEDKKEPTAALLFFLFLFLFLSFLKKGS